MTRSRTPEHKHTLMRATSTKLLLTGALLLAGCGDCNTPPASIRDMNATQGDMTPADMPKDIAGLPDQDVPDQTSDMPDAPDSDTMDMPDQAVDMMNTDMRTDMDMGSPQDMDVDMDPGISTCPEDLRNSCLYTALSCFGNTTEQDTCFNDPLLNQQVSVYRNGSQVVYRDRPTANGLRQEFRTISPDGQMCYLAIAQEDIDMPETWEFRDGATMFKHFIAVTDNEVRITCASGDVEVCSRTKFDLYFNWPAQAPEGCPDKDPDDLCNLDSECASGELCCRLGDDTTPKQCAQDDLCLPGRDPKACTTDDDCSSSEVCSKCDRAGRECVPLGFTDNATNSLSCEPDQCNPDQPDACGEPRTCCINGGSFACVIPSECDTPPDPNPVCQVNDQQPCVDPTQACCYVSQLNEFRCIDQNATCRTNVCFSDADCPSNQECCNANPVANTAGACLTQCENEVITCTSDTDCGTAGAGAFCCQYPGYTVGTCELVPENCRIITCETSPSQCDGGNECCNAAPLSTPTCITTGSTCPPDPVQ